MIQLTSLSKLRLLLGDPSRRRCLGRAGTKHVQQYRWDRLADELVEDLNAESAYARGT